MIYRTSKKTGNFIQIDKEVVENELRLSWKAKSILLYMLGKPNDWEFYLKEITSHASDGVKSTRNGIEELIETGYITRSEKRTNNKHGTYNGYYYDVYENCYDNKEMYPNGKPNDIVQDNNIDNVLDVISDD